MQSANMLPPYEFTVGCDPELFIYDTEADTFLSAHNLIEGTKEQPFPVEGGAYQRDGVAAEINITPAKTADEFAFRISQVLSQLEAAIKAKSQNYTLISVPVADFTKNDFRKIPLSVRALGCNPEFSSYDGSVIQKPHLTKPFRTGGGHIHIGWGHDLLSLGAMHTEDCQYLSKSLDVSMLVPSILWDKDGERRRLLYGAPGAYRAKPYGCEYRSLSNAWVTHEGLKRWIFETTVRTAKRWEKGILYTSLATGEEAINLMREFKPVPRSLALSHYYHLRELDYCPPLPKEFV